MGENHKGFPCGKCVYYVNKHPGGPDLCGSCFVNAIGKRRYTNISITEINARDF